MRESSVFKDLQTFIGTRKFVHLTRVYPSEPTLNGLVLDVGKDWVMLHQFHDFYPEGYTTLRVRDVLEVRSGEYERHWERMMEGEGLFGQIVVPEMPLATLPSMLRALQQRSQNVIVECENEDLDLENFYIGRILSVEDDSISFANFDALGIWENQSHEIPTDEITKLQFDTPYLRAFSKYLQGPCPLR